MEGFETFLSLLAENIVYLIGYAVRLMKLLFHTRDALQMVPDCRSRWERSTGELMG